MEPGVKSFVRVVLLSLRRRKEEYVKVSMNIHQLFLADETRNFVCEKVCECVLCVRVCVCEDVCLFAG